jgi:hypothetical protein
MNSTFCYHCGTELLLPLYKSSECPGCGRDAKVCKNCDFYEPGRQYDCREHITEPVRDKERANFCDYFRPAVRSSDARSSDADSGRKAFEDLFS